MDVLSVVVTAMLSPLSVFRTNWLAGAVTLPTVPVTSTRGAAAPCAARAGTEHSTQSKEKANNIPFMSQSSYRAATLLAKMYPGSLTQWVSSRDIVKGAVEACAVTRLRSNLYVQTL
jgi:hypothetical protein